MLIKCSGLGHVIKMGGVQVRAHSRPARGYGGAQIAKLLGLHPRSFAICATFVFKNHTIFIFDHFRHELK